MSSTYKMAWRSLSRNRRRSFVTGAGIALAVAMCMATLGLMDGLSRQLIDGTTELEVGHVQVHHPAYLSHRRLGDTLPAAAQDLAPLQQRSEVLGVSARVFAWGYLCAGSQCGGVQLMGLDPQQEARVTRLAGTLTAGEFVPQLPTPWPEPRGLSEAQQAQDRELTEAAIDDAFAQYSGQATPVRKSRPPADEQDLGGLLAEQQAPKPLQTPRVVLGSKLAANHGLKVGDRVQLLYEGSQGAQSTLDLEVVGLASTGIDAIDRSRVLLHLADLQKMLVIGEQAHELALRLREPRQAEALAQQIAAGYRDGIAREVLPWSKVRPDILALIASNQALMGSLVFIVFLIAGVGVLNTMLVTVMQRQKEISLLKALGRAPAHIVLLILTETLVLAGAACLGGLLAGALLLAWLQQHGLDLSGFGGFSMSGVNMAPVLKAELTLQSALLPLVSLLLVSLLAACFPAVAAARVPAATGLRIE